jgi:hypothetical protein
MIPSIVSVLVNVEHRQLPVGILAISSHFGHLEQSVLYANNLALVNISLEENGTHG